MRILRDHEVLRLRQIVGMNALRVRARQQPVPTQFAGKPMVLVDAELRSRGRADEDDIAAARADPPNRFRAVRDDPLHDVRWNDGSFKPVPRIARVRLQIARFFDPVPHEILPAGEDFGKLPHIIVGTVSTLAPTVI